MKAQLRRDPFARETLMRETVPVEYRKACAYCGSRAGRFVYWHEADSIRGNVPRGERRAFCGVACWEDWHA